MYTVIDVILIIAVNKSNVKKKKKVPMKRIFNHQKVLVTLNMCLWFMLKSNMKI